MMSASGLFRKIVKWLSLTLGTIVVLGVLLVLAVLSPGLYNRFYYFPKQKAAWEHLATLRNEVVVDDGWTDFKGSVHSHSEVSHDSDAAFPEILAALKEIGSDFILMSDHFVDGKADWSLGWKGTHDGVLFVRGFEMQGGLMPWGLPDSTIIEAKEDVGEAAKKIHDLGGVVTFAHCEQERQWDIPELEAMEIYNIHPTFIKYSRDKKFLWKTGANVLTCLNKYGDHCFFALFERPDQVLGQWDELNIYRHISGYGGNDTHQNCGVQARYTPEGDLEICDTGHKFEDEGKVHELNIFSKALLRLIYGKREPGELLFRYDLDKYVRSAHYVRTHFLAKACTEADILDALRAGRAYVSVDMVADATGFVYMAQSGEGRAVMGESIKMAPGLELKAYSPYPAKFELLRHGVKVDEQEGTAYRFTPTETGKYRLEVSLNVLDKDQLWLFTNPIEITN